MDCPHARTLIDSYVDGELASTESAAIDAHLAQCGACRAAFDEHAALGTAIRRNAEYRRAPPSLAARVREATAQSVRPGSAPRRFRLQWPRWLQLGAVAAASAVITAALMLQLDSSKGDESIAAQVVAAHARATLTAHQIDVASSDRHTVKPWLSGKLDFSPPVVDLADSGFPLSGGRLDYVDSRPVAVLVYTYRQHVIDLYAWPAAQARERTYTKNGFNIVRWSDGDLTYWAISDLNASDLKNFSGKFANAR